MKSYTNLEQSKKLAEILPVKSADMVYIDAGYCSRVLPSNDIDANSYPTICPCWSLAALYKILPKCIEGAEPSLIKTFRDDCRIIYDIHGDENITSEDYTNPIDACYEMIIRFHEQKLL